MNIHKLIIIFLFILFFMYYINEYVFSRIDSSIIGNLLSFRLQNNIENFHNFERKKINIIYRNENIDKKKTDMVFILLIHQNKKMVDYMINNIKNMVNGDYMIFIHYNGDDNINENDYNENIWFNKNPLKTERFTKSLAMAVIDTLKYACDNVETINFMIISSGSAFYKKYEIPKEEYIALNNYNYLFKNQSNTIDRISIKYIDNITNYLKNNKKDIWHYDKFDKDNFIKNKIKKRNFKYIVGYQMPGLVMPYNCVINIIHDIYPMNFKIKDIEYCAEELYFPIYLYNYALEKNLKINNSEVITDWNNNYLLDSIDKIKNSINKNFKGHLLSKIPEDTEHPSRKYIESLY